jgi:RHS repeat-associated protein
MARAQERQQATEFRRRRYAQSTLRIAIPPIESAPSESEICEDESFKRFCGSGSRTKYTYDAFGRRVKKVTATQSFVYLYDAAGHLVEEVEKKAGTDHARAYAYVEDELVGLVDLDEEVGAGSPWLAPRGRGPSAPLWALGFVVLGGAGLLLVARRHPREAAAATSAVLLVFTCASGTPTAVVFSWVHTDPLGTPLAVTNTPANPSTTPAVVVWRASYEPFGKATVNQDPDGDGTTLTLNVRFPGQYADAETGLHYNLLRDYDSETGRFVEADPIGVLGGAVLPSKAARHLAAFGPGIESLARSSRMITLVSGPNPGLYQYGRSDPINGVDRLGQSWGLVVAAAGGLTVVALVDLYSEAAQKCHAIADQRLNAQCDRLGLAGEERQSYIDTHLTLIRQ